MFALARTADGTRAKCYQLCKTLAMKVPSKKATLCLVVVSMTICKQKCVFKLPALLEIVIDVSKGMEMLRY